MSSTEARFSVSYSPGKPAMITIRGDSAEEIKAGHEAAVTSGLLETIKQVQDSLNGAARQAAAGPAPVTPATAGTPVQPAQELPAGFAEPRCTECQGPTRLAQQGISKQSGKPYKRYSCTTTSTHKSTFTN